MSIKLRFEQRPEPEPRQKIEAKTEAELKEEARLEAELEKKRENQLKYLVSVFERARHPEIPKALRGMEGIARSDSMLRERNAVGILIGGLAASAWNERSDYEALAKHKDVDVLVITPEFHISQNFEGGIDWWLWSTYQDEEKKKQGIRWRSSPGRIKLKFGVSYNPAQEEKPLPSGLYIPNSDWIIQMRRIEAEAYFKEEHPDEAIDDSVWEEWEEWMRKRFPFLFSSVPPRSPTQYLAKPMREHIFETDDHNTRIIAPNARLFLPPPDGNGPRTMPTPCRLEDLLVEAEDANSSPVAR